MRSTSSCTALFDLPDGLAVRQTPAFYFFIFAHKPYFLINHCKNTRNPSNRQMFFSFFLQAKTKSPRLPAVRGSRALGEERMRVGVQRCHPGVTEGLCQGAAGEAKRGGNSREDADGNLNECFPSVLFHSDRCLRVLCFGECFSIDRGVFGKLPLALFRSQDAYSPSPPPVLSEPPGVPVPPGVVPLLVPEPPAPPLSPEPGESV